MSAEVKDKNYDKNCRCSFISREILQSLCARILFLREADFTRKKCYVNFSAWVCVTKINRKCRCMLGFAHFLKQIIIEQQDGSSCIVKSLFQMWRKYDVLFFEKMCAKVKALCGLLLAYVSAADRCLCPTCMSTKAVFSKWLLVKAYNLRSNKKSSSFCLYILAKPLTHVRTRIG